MTATVTGPTASAPPRSSAAPDPSGVRRRAGSAIFAGKVLSNQVGGADGGILAGIDWAIRNTCTVISMSLGAPVAIGGGFSTVYETVARPHGWQPDRRGGRERKLPPGRIAPRRSPANCPSIIAVAAVDSSPPSPGSPRAA